MRASSAVLVGAVLILAAALGVWLRVPPPSDGAVTVTLRDEQPAPAPVLTGVAPVDQRPLDVDVPSPAVAAERVEPVAPCEDDLAAQAWRLLERLAELEAGDADGYHAAAAGLLEETVEAARESDSCPLSAWTSALVGALDGGVWTEPVRGAALALLAACGDVEAVALRRPARGEAWRGAVLGQGWTVGAAESVVAGLTIDVGAYLERRLLGGLPALPIVLSRVPSPELRSQLESALVTVASEWDGLLDREVALLAMATELDSDPNLLAVYTNLVESSAEHARQVIEVVLFVLMQSRDPAALAALEEFARRSLHAKDPMLALQNRVRLWLSRHASVDVDLALHVGPLRDEGADSVTRMTAISSLAALRDRLGVDQLQQIEEQLALTLEGDVDHVVVTMAVATLAGWPGGAARLASLDRVLRTAPAASHRRLAANGLGATEGDLRGEAQALLRRHRPDETDASVLAAIDAALD